MGTGFRLWVICPGACRRPSKRTMVWDRHPPKDGESRRARASEFHVAESTIWKTRVSGDKCDKTEAKCESRVRRIDHESIGSRFRT